MVMTKKERSAIDAEIAGLKLRLALRQTEDVFADIPIPERSSVLATGWLFGGEQSNWPRVEPSCSSSVHHAFGHTDRTTTQQPRRLFSTKLRALKALRRAVEFDCMARLRKIDEMIEREEGQ